VTGVPPDPRGSDATTPAFGRPGAGRRSAATGRSDPDAGAAASSDPDAAAEARSGSDAVPPPVPVVPGSTGILGGTFDPIHHGHLLVAEEAREVLGLERVLLVPAAVPPHKPGRPVTEAGHRVAMLELAIAGNPALGVDRLEIDRGGASYTVDTLRALRDRGVADPWFILSAEALALFETWREPEAILELCRLAVVPRGGFESLDRDWVSARFPGREHRVRFLAGPQLPISGSVVRHRASAGRSVRYLVPDAVARYIVAHRLYLDPRWRTTAT
jgi:nicotinate-nucleotide adenylyltransferase